MCPAYDWDTSRRRADWRISPSAPACGLPCVRACCLSLFSEQCHQIGPSCGAFHDGCPQDLTSPHTCSPQVGRASCGDQSIFLHSLMLPLALPTLWTKLLSVSSNTRFWVCILFPLGTQTRTKVGKILYKPMTSMYMHVNKRITLISILSSWFRHIWHRLPIGVRSSLIS